MYTHTHTHTHTRDLNTHANTHMPYTYITCIFPSIYAGGASASPCITTDDSRDDSPESAPQILKSQRPSPCALQTRDREYF